MGREYSEIDEKMHRWLEEQPLLFVATAPADPDGLINLSPKGASGTFRVLDRLTVAYVDLIGSGVETVAHLQENGRIVLMFCAFTGPPKIVRLHGTGSVLPAGEERFAQLIDRFDLDQEQRQVVRGIVQIAVSRISDSCGFVVPRMTLLEERDHLFKWADRKHAKHGEAWMASYMDSNNRASVDGLPGYSSASSAVSSDGTELSSEGKAL
jgi:hypothetical protein